MNLYAYVGNDPINATDPTGKCPMCIAGGIGALVGGVVGAGTEAYKQHKAGNGFDAGKIAASGGKGAVVGGLVGFTGGAAGAVVTATGATGSGAAATVALPTATVAAVGSGIVSVTDDIADGVPAQEISSNAVQATIGGGLGAAAGGALSPAIGNALTKATGFGGAGNLSNSGAAVGEAAGNAIAVVVSEFTDAAIPDLPEIDDEIQ